MPRIDITDWAEASIKEQFGISGAEALIVCDRATTIEELFRQLHEFRGKGTLERAVEHAKEVLYGARQGDEGEGREAVAVAASEGSGEAEAEGSAEGQEAEG